MDFFSTIVLFSATFILAYITGMSLLFLLVSKEDDDKMPYLAGPIGYLVYSWVAYIVSGNFGLSGTDSTYVTLSFFGLLFLYANYYHYRTRGEVYNYLGAFKNIVIVTLPIVVFILWPLFYIGTETFLGAVNPDYFAGLFDNIFLLNHSTLEESTQFFEYSYVNSMIGHMPPSARFSSGFFAIMLDVILPVNAQEALTLSVGVFLFSLPLSVYVLSRTVFKFNHQISLLSAFLIGISAPTALSFIYFYVGQNSGLGALASAMVVIYLFLIRQNTKSLLLATFVINAFFVMYMGMLAYIIAPLGLLLIYMLFSKQLALKKTLLSIMIFFAISIIFNFNMLVFLLHSLSGWANIVGQTLQGQYFLDFLTEDFLSLFFGLTSYNTKSSFFIYLNSWQITAVILATMTLIYALFFLYSVYKFIREHTDTNSKVFGIGGFIIYALVWFIYTFERNYGYAVFKMASWVQFLLVIFIAYGIYSLYTSYKQETRVVTKRVKLSVLIIFLIVSIGGNLVSTTRLTTYAFGKNNVTGSIVNVYGVSGSRDYIDIADHVAKFVKKDQTIGVVGVNSVQNELVGFYLRDFKTSIMSHLELPGDDENLPDTLSNEVIDYYGNVKIVSNPFLHKYNDFYLINKSEKNQDITLNQLSSKPIYENGTFALYRSAQVKDFLFTGRGWYRLEHADEKSAYKWPRNYRWTSEGAEVMLLNSDKTKEYTLEFFAYVGYGLEDSTRTLEIWVNKKKIDEVKVDKSAVIRTKAFIADQEINVIVIKPQERVEPLKRKLPLWNKDVPYDYRRLNLLVSDIKVQSNHYNESVEGLDIFSTASYYNGLEPNGWAGKTLEIGFDLKDQINTLGIDIMLPDNEKIPLPSKMICDINGMKKEFVFNQYGNHRLEFTLEKSSKAIAVKIHTENSFVPEHSTDERGIDFSYYLERFTFENK